MCHLPMNAVSYPAFWRYCGKNVVPGGTGLIVVDDAVAMGVEAGEDRSAARRAERGRDERVLEVDAVALEGVEVRRLEQRVAHEAERVEAQVVGQDEDDVAPRDGARLFRCGGG